MKKYRSFVSNLKALEDIEILFQDEVMDQRVLSFALSGAVSKFSVQMELAWKLLAELLVEEEGVAADLVRSPRGTIKEAQAAYGDSFPGDLWIAMLGARNHIVHMYGDERVRELVGMIRAQYIPAFQDLQMYITARYGVETLEAQPQQKA